MSAKISATTVLWIFEPDNLQCLSLTFFCLGLLCKTYLFIFIFLSDASCYLPTLISGSKINIHIYTYFLLQVWTFNNKSFNSILLVYTNLF
jgi:hypothetical protein